jgi:protein-L-isoaspartate(D-aspartate) O-methyltransferase
MRRLCGVLGTALIAIAPATALSQEGFPAQRAQMVADIAAMARLAAVETSRPTLTPRVLAAMNKVPRHRFVPPEQVPYAYENRPLPIGHGQTISQPFIVALMTDLLEPKPTDRVLEVGTGSGYQAAVLAELTAQVYSIEIIAAVGKRAEATLNALAYRNIAVRIGDGYRGWPEAAPFDGIMVTAAAPYVPPPLIDQLKVGGRMVIPVGERAQSQELLILVKQPDGSTTTQRILPVRFVPLTRDKRN